MNTVEKIVQSRQCIGCGLCEVVGKDVGVRMAYDKAGFLRPTGVEKMGRAQVAEIEASCRAIQSDYVSDSRDKLAAGQKHDFMWGSYYDCKVGHTSDPNLRHRASSGGALSAFASFLLESGEADWVLATDYATSDKLKTEVKLATTSAEVIALSGSKYAPASPLAKLNDILERSGKVVAIGKPCDISVLRLHINQNPNLASRFVALLSFFCAGTPSDTVNAALVEKLGVTDRTKVTDFKHRGEGWPGYTRVTTSDGQQSRCTYKESWGGVLNKDLQFGCKICADGVGEAADLVCADAWYGDDGGYPDFSEAEGRSLIMSRTLQGAAILQKVETANVLVTEPLDAREIDRMQPGQLKRRRYLGVRRLAMIAMMQNRPRYNLTALHDYERGLRLKDKVSAFGGTVLRLIKAKKATH